MLLCGNEEKVHAVMESEHATNYVTMNEYCSLFPDLVPISMRSAQEQVVTMQTLKKRIHHLRDHDF